ncbi:MAG: sulfatase-like hydrolase/transferase [Chloroflexota bacterium]
MTSSSTQPYNILFVLTDQERHVDQPPPSLKRPGLEKLQQMGTTFENHQICSAVCSPSRSNIYTGQHIVHTGIFDNVNFPWQKDLSTKMPTMGDRMRDAGYYTAYKGKWHLTKRFEQEYKEGMKSLSLEKYGFSDFHGIGDVIGETLGGHHFDTMTTASAIHWLRSQGEVCRDEGQPWLLAVNLVNPHDVMYFDADPEDEVLQGEKTLLPIARAPKHEIYQQQHDVPLPENWNQPLDEPGRPATHAGYMQIHDLMLGYIPPDDEARWQRYQDYYFNCIQDMDIHLKQLLDELDALELTKNTIIIYTSDHGELGSAHGMRGKGNCAYKEQNNVPLIIAHPAHTDGTRCRAVTSHIDLLPTMIGATGLSVDERVRLSEGLPGQDLSSVLADPEAAAYDAIRPGALFAFNMLSYFDPRFVKRATDSFKARQLPDGPPNLENLRGAIRSVFDGRYRYTRYFFPKQHNRPETLDEILQYNDIELFDLQSDPNENHNLARNPDQCREIIEALNAKMNALIDMEISEDVGQMLPLGDKIVNWSIKRFDP